MAKQLFKLAAVLAPAVLMVGCATRPVQPYDYSAFEASNPRSILVLPPVNNSPDVKATESVYSTVTYPLAEAGFYVMPVALVNETFRQNGLTMPADIHNVNPEKLRQIFGADAALYITVDKYGSSYNIVSSVTTVAAKAKLLDLKTGAQLWDGEVTVVDDGNQGGGNSGGLIGMLVKAAVTQIMNNSLNRSHEVAARANSMLLSGGMKNGVLYGPRSPLYKGRDASIPVAEAAATPPDSTPMFTSAAAATAATAAPVAAQAPAAVVPAAAPAAAIAAASPAPAMVPAALPVAAPVPVPAAAAAPAPAPGMANLSAEEQRYVDIMVRARARNQALDPSSAWYRPELYDWVIARKDEFVRAGQKPDVALQMALTAMERN